MTNPVTDFCVKALCWCMKPDEVSVIELDGKTKTGCLIGLFYTLI